MNQRKAQDKISLCWSYSRGMGEGLMQSQILGIKNAGAFDLSELKQALCKDGWFLSISKQYHDHSWFL